MNSCIDSFSTNEKNNVCLSLYTFLLFSFSIIVHKITNIISMQPTVYHIYSIQIKINDVKKKKKYCRLLIVNIICNNIAYELGVLNNEHVVSVCTISMLNTLIIAGNRQMNRH